MTGYTYKDKMAGSLVVDEGYVAKVQTVDGSGNDVSGASGSKDPANSTETPLGAGATFTGDWVENTDDHIAASWFADQDGEMFIDISRNDGTTTAFSKRYDHVGGEGRFDAFVKGSRAHRVRFINGSTAQSTFELAILTGGNLYPYALSGRERPVANTLFISNLSSTTDYRFYIDVSDRVNYPHREVGHVELSSANFFYDKTSNCRGSMRLCVITRIDGTSADLASIAGTSFTNSDLTKDTRDRSFVGEELRLDVDDSGNLVHFYASANFTNVTAVNTGTTLATGKGGTAIPAVGDVIARTEITAGTLDTGFYSGSYKGVA